MSGGDYLAEVIQEVIDVEIGIEDVVLVEVAAEHGPAGPAGVPVFPGIVAGETMGGDKLVYAASDGKAYLASQNAALAGKILGFTKNAVIAGATVDIVAPGNTIPLAGLTPGAEYFVGPNPGDITATPDSSGLLQSVGTAITSTQLGYILGPAIVRP